ncbi:MAG: rhomboid family intramembrane serine protease [Thermogutta sp.]|uniref:rhomboid family intramembrane serine protease n=1 Tax=Thermogutta sp. TaxID=1962930 RepID=UPI001988AACE|nr:rhomboid family intramembrane serine protease [Thermogutta sp.]MBC7351399.1 rhomboid family intramembrane serine protease [Thermogutta sp.]
MGLYDRDYITRRTMPGGAWSTSQYSMVTILIVINVVVYVLDAFSNYRLSALTAARVGTLTRPWLWWQFLTYGFTHAPSPQHIFFNMLTLWFFGRDIEYLLGRKEFLRLYLFLVIAGGVVWAAVNQLQGAPAGSSVIGASGAVVGIFLLFCLHYPRRTILLFFFLPVPAWLAGVLLLAPDLMSAIQSKESEVAYSVHLTGAALAALYYYQNWNLGLFWERLGGERVWVRIKYLFQRRPRLRVHRGEYEYLRDMDDVGDPTDAEKEEWEKLEAEVERILDKINKSGTDSLTRAERRTLERASQLYRQRRRGS